MNLQEGTWTALNQVNVNISPPYGFSRGGAVWRTDEYAWVKGEVNNSTGLLLREVAIHLQASGAAYITGVSFWPGFVYGDGKWAWAELEPGETGTYYVRLKSRNIPGNVHMWVRISAEVVPYASIGHISHRTDNIEQF